MDGSVPKQNKECDKIMSLAKKITDFVLNPEKYEKSSKYIAPGFSGLVLLSFDAFKEDWNYEKTEVECHKLEGFTERGFGALFDNHSTVSDLTELGRFRFFSRTSDTLELEVQGHQKWPSRYKLGPLLPWKNTKREYMRALRGNEQLWVDTDGGGISILKPENANTGVPITRKTYYRPEFKLFPGYKIKNGQDIPVVGFCCLNIIGIGSTLYEFEATTGFYRLHDLWGILGLNAEMSFNGALRELNEHFNDNKKWNPRLNTILRPFHSKEFQWENSDSKAFLRFKGNPGQQAVSYRITKKPWFPVD